jgi:hypothetical protein
MCGTEKSRRVQPHENHGFLTNTPRCPSAILVVLFGGSALVTEVCCLGTSWRIISKEIRWKLIFACHCN